MTLECLTVFSDSACTVETGVLNYGDEIYFNVDLCAKLATSDSPVTLKTYDDETDTLIDTVLDTTHSFPTNVLQNLKTDICSGTAPHCTLTKAGKYPGGLYYAVLAISGSDVDDWSTRAYFTVPFKPGITSPAISAASISEEATVRITFNVTAEADHAEVHFLDGDGLVVYTKQAIISGTSAYLITDPLGIPVGVYAAGQIRIYAFNDEDAAIDITSGDHDDTLELTVTTSAGMPTGMLEWLNQEITREAATTKDDCGQYSYSAGVTVACRIIQNVQTIMSSQGKEVVSSSEIHINGTQAMTVNDRITLPDSTTPEILKITSIANALGTAFKKVIYT